jgi:CspA family cold shock protein
LVERKGFGFVAPDEGSGDIFLHFSELTNGGARDMAVGMRVQFAWEADQRSGKRRARHATILRGDAAADGAETGSLEAPRCASPLPAEKGATGEGDGALSPAWCVTEDEGRASEEPFSYERNELLRIFRSLPRGPPQGIHTIQIPQDYDYGEQKDATTASKDATGRRGRGRRSDKTFIENPCLDDEDLLVAMEAREARESGADAKNAETFGAECLDGGWTFEEALAANTKLNQQDVAFGCPSTATSSDVGGGSDSAAHSDVASPASGCSADPREGLEELWTPAYLCQ